MKVGRQKQKGSLRLVKLTMLVKLIKNNDLVNRHLKN